MRLRANGCVSAGSLLASDWFGLSGSRCQRRNRFGETDGSNVVHNRAAAARYKTVGGPAQSRSRGGSVRWRDQCRRSLPPLSAFGGGVFRLVACVRDLRRSRLARDVCSAVPRRVFLLSTRRALPSAPSTQRGLDSQVREE